MKEIIKKPQNRLTNRATMALYPPGSVFKPIVAIAGVKEKEIDSRERINCKGEFLLGKNSKFRCHNRSGHGNISLAKALEKSCNVYFYDLGVRLGIDRIHYYSEIFGFGKLTGINGLLENKGVVPSRAWKKLCFLRNLIKDGILVRPLSCCWTGGAKSYSNSSSKSICSTC